MDKQTGQTPFTDGELAQALRLGTDSAARRQGALRAGVLARVQNPKRRRPLLQTLAAAAAVVLLVAGLWALANRLPQWDVVQPLATTTPQIPTITLTTNIQAYTPALSSVQGITITARDSFGNPLSGDWKASWGVFLGPVSEQGNLIPTSGNYADTLQDTARVLWSFAPDAEEIPANIRITFTTADGQSATLLLTQDRGKTGFVRVAASVNRLTLLTNTDHYTYDPESPFVGGFQMLISAVDAQGDPVDGDWKASFGAFGGNATDGFVTTMKDTSSVIWYFVALIGEGAPENAEITFTAADGFTQTLHLERDPQDNMTLRIRADEIQPLAAALQSPPVLRCNAEGCANQYNRNLISSLKIESVEADGSAIAGIWKASFGKIEGFDVSPTSNIRWSFSAEDSSSIPETVEISFYVRDGRKKTLHLDRDADNPDLMRVRTEDLVLIPQTPSTSAPVAMATPAPSIPNIPAMNFDNVASIELTREHTEVIPLTEVQQADLMSAINAGSTLGDDSIGTTPTYGVTVTMKDGTIVRLWGLNQRILTYALIVDGKEVEQHNIVNQLLLQWFQNLVNTASSPSATTNPSPVPDGALIQTQANRLREYLREFSAIPRGEAGFAQEYHGDWDGDSKQDYAYLSDSATGSAGISNSKFITIAFGNGMRLTVDAKDLAQRTSWGSNFLLEAADLTGDGKNEIILLIDLGGQGGRGSYGLYPYAHSSDGWKIMEAPYHGYTLALNWKDGKASVTTGDYSETVADADMLQAHCNAAHAEDQWNQVRNTDYHNESAADAICDISLAKEDGRTVVKICQYTVGMTGVHVDGLGYLITTLSWDIQGKCTPSETHFVLYPQ